MLRISKVLEIRVKCDAEEKFRFTSMTLDFFATDEQLRSGIPLSRSLCPAQQDLKHFLLVCYVLFGGFTYCS